MVRKITSELIFNAAFGLVTLTFGIFIDKDPRQPVAEFQLQPRSDALGQLANLFQTSPFRTINFADTLVASASTILRWMVRKGIGSGNCGSRTYQKNCGRYDYEACQGNLLIGPHRVRLWPHQDDRDLLSRS